MSEPWSARVWVNNGSSSNLPWYKHIRVFGYESRYEKECREEDERTTAFLRDSGVSIHPEAYKLVSGPITMTGKYGPVTTAPHIVMEFDDVVYHFYPTLEDE